MPSVAVHAYTRQVEAANEALRALIDRMRTEVMRRAFALGGDRPGGRSRAIPTGADPSSVWDWRLYKILNSWNNNALPGAKFGPAEEEHGS